MIKNIVKKGIAFRDIVFVSSALVLLAGFAGCGKKVQKPEEMAFGELKENALALIEQNKHNNAIEYLEQLVAQYPEHQDIFEYKFMLADLYLKVGRLEEAHSLYNHYTQMYPSEMRTEDAHYKSILSTFYQTLKVSKSCDDTDTQRTLGQCKRYLANNSYKKFYNDVKDIQHTCQRRLIDKEIYVFNTYLRRKKYKSAKNRVAYLREKFLPDHPALEAQILYLESKLAHKQQDQDLAKQKTETLFAKYPESRFTKMAHSMITAKPRKFIF